MSNSKEASSFLDRVDEIQEKFLRNLVTGERDPISIPRKIKNEAEKRVPANHDEGNDSETLL